MQDPARLASLRAAGQALEGNEMTMTLDAVKPPVVCGVLVVLCMVLRPLLRVVRVGWQWCGKECSG